MPTVLTSWKEISDHLGKGVRTVQRWEIELGLPVHRSDANFPRAIFALPQELDAWARSHPLAPAAAVVASLYREIAGLREYIFALSDRLDGLERACRCSEAPGSDGGARKTSLLLRNEALLLRNEALMLQRRVGQSRLALRATIGQSQTLRKASEAARDTPFGRFHAARIVEDPPEAATLATSTAS